MIDLNKGGVDEYKKSGAEIYSSSRILIMVTCLAVCSDWTCHGAAGGALIAAPLRAGVEAVSSIAQMNLTVQLESRTRDELGMLTE